MIEIDEQPFVTGQERIDVRLNGNGREQLIGKARRKFVMIFDAQIVVEIERFTPNNL